MATLSENTTPKSFWSLKSLAWSSAGISFAVVLAFAAYRYHYDVSNAFSNATTQKAEVFTELYFADYQSLSHYLKVGTPNSYSFAVSNHESHATNYRYEVWLSSDGVNQLLKASALQLEVGQTIRTRVDVLSTQPLKNYRLVVKLLDQKQEINLRLQS